MIKYLAQKLKRDASRNEGMVLIEAALMLLLGGLLIGGFVATLRPVDRESQTEVTREKMQRVIYALSIHTQKYDRVPCPADPAGAGAPPFGAERGSGAGGNAAGSCTTAADVLGIVPFKTLGLSENDVRDEWGNYMTYRISTTLGAINFNPALPPGLQPDAHDLCRVKDVWVVPSAGSAVDKNVDPEKALFCCPRPEAGFDVVDRNNNTYVPDPSNCSGNGSCGGSFGNLHSPAPPSSIPAGSEVPDVLAVVLLSHGRNGFGAFLRDGTRIDSGNAANYSGAEQENADNDGMFILFGPSSEAETNYFDDIIMWRTQALLYTELGGNYGSCADPLPGNNGGGGGGN